MFREHRHNTAEDTSEGSGRAAGSVLPKVIAVVAVIGILRMLASHKRGHGEGASWRDRRRAMIAELHRELHREDAQQGDGAAEGTAKADSL